VCEVWLHGHGARVRATAQAADARAALDAVVDKLQHQLERRRTRRLARDR
jgi:ribosome-associated translation inhibitor RaiA